MAHNGGEPTRGRASRRLVIASPLPYGDEALLQYLFRLLFLTDDSGVGNAHAEPHLTNYHVERLDKLMIRMIAAELTGKRIPVEPNDILRTVGRPQ